MHQTEVAFDGPKVAVTVQLTKLVAVEDGIFELTFIAKPEEGRATSTVARMRLPEMAQLALRERVTRITRYLVEECYAASTTAVLKDADVTAEALRPGIDHIMRQM